MGNGKHAKNGERLIDILDCAPVMERIPEQDMRRENGVIEIILELRQAVTDMLASQRTLLQNLIAAQDALRLYRLQAVGARERERDAARALVADGVLLARMLLGIDAQYEAVGCPRQSSDEERAAAERLMGRADD